MPDGSGSKRRFLILGSVVCLILAATGGSLYVRHLNSRQSFRTAPVTRGPLAAAVSATGTLNAVITVQVGSQVSGQIKEMFVDFNSAVKKGQVIARINPALFEAQVNQAKAQLDGAQAMVLNQQAVIEKTRADLESSRAALAAAHAQAVKSQVAVVDGKRNFGRQHDLRERNLIAQSDEDAAQVQYDSAVAQYESSVAQERAQGAALRSAEGQLKVAETLLRNLEAQVDQTKANLEQARLSLGYTVIQAPVDGVVVARNGDIGQTVAASLQAPTLFVIAQDLTKMQVDTNVDEADVGRLQVGQRATFTVDAFPGRTFAGAITQVRKAAQILQNVVTYDVVVSADNTDLKLLPGMTANIRVVTDQRESALRVPNAALRFRPPGVEADRPLPGGNPAGGQVPGTRQTPGAGGRAAAASAQTGRLWILSPEGKPTVIRVQLGISDGQSTEVLSDAIKEGERVIVGAGSGGDQPPGSSGSGQRLRL